MKSAWLVSAMLVALLAASPGMAQSNPGAPSTTSKSAPAAKSGAPPQTAVLPSERRIDLNSASESELDTLPGIGKARADAIVKNRPYKSTDDLVSRHVIPQKVYDGLKDKVVVR